MEYKTLEKRMINNEQVNSILASELHQKLEIKTAFTDWFRREIEAGMFEESIDYVIVWEGLITEKILSKLDKVPKLKHNLKASNVVQSILTKDFGISADKIAKVLKLTKNAILTLDTSKEVSMMSKTLKGKESMKYFINVEKIAKNTLGEEKLKLELKKLKQEIRKEENVIEYEYIDQRLKLAERLQRMGANFDPLALSKGEFKTMLPKDIGETLTNVMSDIRVGVKASSITHLINLNAVPIRPRDFITALIELGLMERAKYKGRSFNRFIADSNWYGFNKPSSSIRVQPSSVLVYDDRFDSLVKLLENEGFIENKV